MFVILERSEEPLYFVFAFVVVPLSSIPARNLHSATLRAPSAYGWDKTQKAISAT
jgi:hypothetical protein